MRPSLLSFYFFALLFSIPGILAGQNLVVWFETLNTVWTFESWSKTYLEGDTTQAHNDHASISFSADSTGGGVQVTGPTYTIKEYPSASFWACGGAGGGQVISTWLTYNNNPVGTKTFSQLEISNWFVNTTYTSQPGNWTWVQVVVDWHKMLGVPDTSSFNGMEIHAQVPTNPASTFYVDDWILIASNFTAIITTGEATVIVEGGGSSGSSQVGTIAGAAGGGGGGVLIAAIIVLVLVYQMRKRKGLGLFGMGTSWKIDYADLEFVRRIGVGSYGEVFLGNYRSTQVAIKKLFKQQLDAKALKEFAQETAFMCNLRHPNITLFMGACTVPPNLCMVTEYMIRGNLYDLLHNQLLNFSWAIKLDMAYKAALGLNFLHTSKPSIVHGDFKSMNLLVDAQWNVKVTDFGLSKFRSEGTDLNKEKQAKAAGSGSGGSEVSGKNASELSEGKKALLKDDDGQVGSILWAAPEVLKHSSQSSTKADVYSYGIVMWELATREDPYHDLPLQAVPTIVASGRRPPLPSDSPLPRYVSLIQQCWQQDPQQRPNFQQILAELEKTKAESSQLDLGSLVPQEAAPRGFVALAFTDVKSSTALWEFDAQSMLQALELHDTLLRELMKKHGGYYVKSEGDSFMVAFHNAEACLNWCISVQEGLMKILWPPGLLQHEAASIVTDLSGKEVFKGLSVRMGCHYGEPKCKEDPTTGRMDYFGKMVNKAARIEGMAKGGQIFVSDAFFKQVEAKAHTFSFKEIGSARLKGIEGLHSIIAIYPKAYASRHDFFNAAGVLNNSDAMSSNSFGFNLLTTSTGTASGSLPEGSQSTKDIALLSLNDSRSLLVSQETSGVMAAKDAAALKSAKPSWKISMEQLALKERIGSGGFGEIFKAIYQGTPVAVKKLLNQQASNQLIYYLQKECLILLHLRHPNIIMFMGACFEPGKLCIVTDYCANGNLATYIDNKSNPLDWRLRIRIARETAQGMNYLHNREPKIIHCDLKPSNLLLDHSMTTKICDFGMSRVKMGNKTMTHTGGATMAYTAPELLQAEKYSEKIDVYSYAMILFELYERQRPNGSIGGMQYVSMVVKEDYRPPLSATMPKTYADLIKQCWTRDSTQRPGFEEVLALLDLLEKSISIL